MLTIDELLKSRIECHGIFLGMKEQGFELGVIFHPNKEDYFYPEKYPANFRWLLWWQKRKPEELPRYIKCLNQNKIVHEVLTWEIKTMATIAVTANNLRLSMQMEEYLPATEQEYKNYVAK
jgi:hypothetical protein